MKKSQHERPDIHHRHTRTRQARPRAPVTRRRPSLNPRTARRPTRPGDRLGDDWLFRVHCPRASIERMPRVDIIRLLREAATFRKALSADGSDRSVAQWQRLFRDAMMFFGGEWLRTTLGGYGVNRISDLSRDACAEALTQTAKRIAA